MTQNAIRRIELLAPAKNKEIAIEAINHGADAVYMGASSFGARAAAGNSVDDIAEVVSYAHQFNVRVYVTVNTIVYDSEIREVEQLIRELYIIKVDALIIQDMGILRMNIPPIAVHASTQCDLRTPQKAEFLESLGFSQLVMARELSLSEIKAIHDVVNIPLEAFVHGALCVSYSGKCHISEALKGRSANRGECAQICRLPFDLIDSEGNVLVRNKHLLSLKDFNLSDRLEQMLDAGVSSFKIEGRLKDVGYVKNVVAYYRKALDMIIEDNPEKYLRASVGKTAVSFTPNLNKSFNRQFTHYFIDNKTLPDGASLSSMDTPKSMGEKAGNVVLTRGKTVKIKRNVNINNGDGLSYFDSDGYTGFRVNRIEGDTIHTAISLKISAGTQLYRTYDKEFEDIIAHKTARRKIAVSEKLSISGENILTLTLIDERGNVVVHSVEAEQSFEDAKSPQKERQMAILEKLGDTIYQATDIDVLDSKFISASILTQLRRNAIAKLDEAQTITYGFEYRCKENTDSLYSLKKLTYADNVANDLASGLYKSHGVENIVPAIETGKVRLSGDEILMNTRYCIRKELGVCRKSVNAKGFPESIFLRYGTTILSVDCNCKDCEMMIRIKK